MRSINANTGLSNSAVTSLCQDTDGTLWIGTWDGLNKYDGETYIQYRHINNVSSSLSHQVVRNIAEEDSTHIWISTDYGINRLNKVTGQCSQYYLSYGKQYIYQENVFLCDASLNANAVVAALRGQTLLIYNKETDSFTPENSIYDINQLFFDNDGKLWVVCQQNSLYCLTINETKANVDYTTYLNDDVKSSLHYDGKDKIWFINADILNYINVRTREIISTDVKMLDETHLSSAISLNDSSTLLGNTNGSYILQHEKLIPILDTEVSVLSLLQGQNGEIWIGTDGKGIIQLYEKNNSIRYYPSQDFQESDNFAIRSILNVSDSMLWVGSKGGGLTLIELLNENESHPIMNYNVGYGKTNNSVFSLAKNGETLWVGTDGQGLLYLSDKTRGIQKLRFSDEKLHFDKASVYCILFANNNTLFAGTSGQGLYRIVLDENNVATEIEQFYHDDTNPESIGSNVVYDLLDDGNYIWIATRGGGLCRMNKQTYELNSYKSIIGDTTSLCSNDVISICLDRNNRIWVGTTTGLSYGTRIGSDYKFTSLDEKNGLPNTNIHFISEDGNGYIWVSTSHGLARINESTLNITPYYYEDGLQSNEFSDGSGCHCDKSDIIYFGGVNGLNCIHTSDLHESAEMPNMILSGVSDGEKIYESLDGTYHIGYKVSTIKFNFSIIEYINNKKCQFAYRLQRQSGFIPSVETPWINLGTQREVILSGLSSGTYKLEVTCSNANRLWGNSQTYMFMIDTPWWLSAWAIISYIFIVFGIVFIMVQHRQKSLKMQHDLELSKRDRQNKENVHQAKLRFFTNIAHEFSNSITLIYGAAEQLLSNTTDPNIKRQLTSIHGNAERMHNQIQELMEFRKAETGHLVLQYEPIDIPELINITADDFLTIADEQQIELSINISSALSTWVTDRSKLEKIIFNFLSNAVKYTPEHGYIKLNAGIIDQKLSISVTNNGPGIKSSELENIFNRFTVLDNFEKKLTQGHYSRTGIGLALCKDLVKLMGGTISADSKENEYTTFRVLLPQNEITEINQNTEIPKLEKQNNVFEEIIRENRQTILIVDDQQDICQLICEIIGDEYETITVHNGEEALEAITHKTPNLIISDILMPKMNGIELINHLKKQEAYKYIPIIILSSKTDMESQIETLNIGASLFIGKPFHPRYLKTAIENMLSNSTMMKQFSGTSAAYMERFNDSMISKDDRELMNRIIEDLNANYSDEDYDQHQLAENLALSDMQLYRRLKKIAKITPSDFIRSYRIRQAEQMLINSDKTIQEIMVNCGFHNKAYFYRIFAETHNCSPKEYRENKK